MLYVYEKKAFNVLSFFYHLFVVYVLVLIMLYGYFLTHFNDMQGTIHVQIGEEHYTWSCVTSAVQNIVVGNMWVDSYGEMRIENHTNGGYVSLEFKPYSYFGSREVGVVEV